MLSSVGAYHSLLRGIMKLAGVRPQLVHIDRDTVLNFWAPTRPDKKPAVVLLQGFFANGILTWQFQVPALSRDYSVYVPDLLFFGGSVTNSPRRSLDFQAECVAKGLRNLGVERCAVSGLSYGAMVGFTMAELYPELVQSIVVTSSATALTSSISDVAVGRIGGFSSWSEFLLPETVNGLKMSLEVATYKLPWLPDFFYSDLYKTIFDHRKERHELLEASTNFTIPNHPKRVHFLCGQNDNLFDSNVADNMKMLLGERATIDLIEKAGHLVHLERPCAYNVHLKKALHF